MHFATVIRWLKQLVEMHCTGSRLDEKQRLGGNRVIQLLGVVRIVTPNADDLAQRLGELLTIGKTGNKAHGGSPPSRYVCCFLTTELTFYRTRGPVPANTMVNS